MTAFTAERAERTHAFIVDLPMARAFKLFEPEGERAWAKGWDPTYLHPSDGRAQAGMVFTTSHGAEETVWMSTRYEPAAGLVEYARLTPGSRIGTVLVQCSRVNEKRTRVTVIYTLTGLTDKGNAYIRGFDESHYRDFIESWQKAISAIA